MTQSHSIRVLTCIGARTCGVFAGVDAVAGGVSRRQLVDLVAAGVVERLLPDTYRLTSVPRSRSQRLHAALIWAGNDATGEGRSAGAVYGLEGVHANRPEVSVPRSVIRRHRSVAVSRTDRREALMVRMHDGVRVTGVEATIVRLAHLLDEEALEIACEDARRRRLTSIPALRAYLDRYATPGYRGVAVLRRLLGELDPVHPSRSTLEVKTRRLLVAHGLTAFTREFPLAWNGRDYYFDFAFGDRRTILETNGRRWHDDPADYEYDNEKWSVPGRHGYKLVMATKYKVTKRPDLFVCELRATLDA